MTDTQHNTDEIVAAGVDEKFAKRLARIIENSIAAPIAGIRNDFKRLEKNTNLGLQKMDQALENFNNGLNWNLRYVVTPILALIFATGAYLTNSVIVLNERVARVEVNGDQVEERLTRVDERLTRVEGRLIGIEGRLTRVEERLIGVEERGVRTEEMLKQIFIYIKGSSGLALPVPGALTEQAGVGLDVQPVQSGQPPPLRKKADDEHAGPPGYISDE